MIAYYFTRKTSTRHIVIYVIQPIQGAKGSKEQEDRTKDLALLFSYLKVATLVYDWEDSWVYEVSPQQSCSWRPIISPRRWWWVKTVDSRFPHFSKEIRNVRLGLSTDGFDPFRDAHARKYTVWHVVVVVYNLPPSMCTKAPYTFMPLLIPGPSDPTKDLHVYLRPLIDELKLLWHTGVETYDRLSHTKFTMKATLMWTISDGYILDIARCVNFIKNSIHGMKSHDCHIFMQKPLPIICHDVTETCSWCSYWVVQFLSRFVLS